MLKRPREPFVSRALGYDVVLHPTNILDDDDPHVLAYPGAFVDVRAEGRVEDATARPGEMRGQRRR